MKRAPFVLALLLVAASAMAQPTTTRTLRVDLGGGLAVERTCAPNCWTWTPTGFSFGDAGPWLLWARSFVRVPATGTVLASLAGRPGYREMRPRRVILTDDGGAHWTDVSWSWRTSPTSWAFDAHDANGVATDGGLLWTTSDGGHRWTEHGGRATTGIAAIAIADREIVLIDALGNVQRTRDGFTRETVTMDPTATLEQRETDVLVRGATDDWIVRRGDASRRVRH
jgi:hypothetical protein